MNRKAQSTLEYAILIAVAIAAVLAMSAYIKRGIQGRLKANADELSAGSAYAPKATTSKSIIKKSSAESTHSYSEIDSTTSTDIKENNITESKADITQSIQREEVIVPFDQEPAR